MVDKYVSLILALVAAVLANTPRPNGVRLTMDMAVDEAYELYSRMLVKVQRHHR